MITACDVDVASARALRSRHRAARFEAPALVVATGGLSIPKIGATDFGYRIAAQFGVDVIAPRPALVPLLFDDADRAPLERPGRNCQLLLRLGSGDRPQWHGSRAKSADVSKSSCYSLIAG